MLGLNETSGSEQLRLTLNILVGSLNLILYSCTIPAYSTLGNVGRISALRALYFWQGLSVLVGGAPV